MLHRLFFFILQFVLGKVHTTQSFTHTLLWRSSIALHACLIMWFFLLPWRLFVLAVRFCVFICSCFKLKGFFYCLFNFTIICIWFLLHILGSRQHDSSDRLWDSDYIWPAVCGRHYKSVARCWYPRMLWQTTWIPAYGFSKIVSFIISIITNLFIFHLCRIYYFLKSRTRFKGKAF